MRFQGLKPGDFKAMGHNWIFNLVSTAAPTTLLLPFPQPPPPPPPPLRSGAGCILKGKF
jgi:hypothetical protein